MPVMTSSPRPHRFRLPYVPPYDFAALLAFFERRAIPDIEQVDAFSYRRSFAFDGVRGSLRVAQKANDNALVLTTDFPDAARMPEIRTRVRRMFDLDVDIAAINTHLGKSVPLRSCIRRHPGQRVPGGWDGFEIVVRAVLGQQISVSAARTLASRLVQNFGVSMGTMENVQLFPIARNAGGCGLDPYWYHAGPCGNAECGRTRGMRRSSQFRSAAIAGGIRCALDPVARHRRLDRTLHRHARNGFSRRLSGRRSGAAQGGGRRWDTGIAEGFADDGRGLAALPCLFGAAFVAQSGVKFAR